MRYICLECGEEFEFEFGCTKHHLEKGHENYGVNGSDYKFTIRS